MVELEKIIQSLHKKLVKITNNGKGVVVAYGVLLLCQVNLTE